ncbi:MAG: DEAD/DEAH box helicase [Planctomycetes bacterium]|nr:DEAD/DEAH box helicase [Planctomycetota bacterium]
MPDLPAAGSDDASIAHGAITHWRGYTLSPFQREAVAAIGADQDVLISAPTGSGKTLVAEYAIEMAIAQGKRAIYTAPIKALSNQKFRDFRALQKFDVGIMTGDVTLRPKAPLLIMTTEIFRNSLFERGEELADLGTIVFDEIHYMDDVERGTVWEESLIYLPPTVRLVALSATVSNLGQFCDWLTQVRGRPIVRVESKERPVPLIHYLHLPGIGPKRAEKVKEVPAPTRDARRRGRDGRGGGPPRGGGRVSASDLLDRLEREEQLPALFFCFSRKEVEQRARENARRQLLDAEQRARIEELFADLVRRFEIREDSALDELRHLARAGVSFHHAGLLPLHKELVERLFTSGLLRLLFTTETFALGINMPARSVVFSSLRKFDGVGFDRLRTREYQQMAGRAGRLGLDDQGLVFSIVDPRDRIADLRRTIFGNVEPIRSRFNLSYSTILNLHHHLGERLWEAWERSFNNFQWANMPRKKREQNEQKQRDAINKRLTLLRELGYVDEEKVLAKGHFARRINGYELPAVELVDSGLLRALDDRQLAIVLAAIVFEERKSDLFTRLDPRVLGPFKEDAWKIVERIPVREAALGIHPRTRSLDFNIGAVMAAWWDGATFDEIGQLTNASQGDLVRTMRLVMQLLKQMRKVYAQDSALVAQLERVHESINREEIDAKRQLELGDPAK